MSRLSLAAERSGVRHDPDPAETAIARLAQADRALAEAIEVADAVQLVGTAKALREWASAVHAGKDHERQAAVFVLRAVRNAGERIADAQARGELATRDHGGANVNGVGAGDTVSPATLAEIGVTRDESSEWKRLAAQYPTDEALAQAAEAMPAPSLSGALRLAPLMSSERVLREQGRISAHEAMFDLVDEHGRRHSITRLAPVIDDLRNRRGWDIETRSGPGQQAVYHLRGVPNGHPIGRSRTCPSCRGFHPVGTTCAIAVATYPAGEAENVLREMAGGR